MNNLSRLLGGAATLCVAAFPLLAANDVAKVPWEWTTEERLQARFDPMEARARHLAYENESQTVSAADNAASGLQYASVVGSKHPELLLPHELFGVLGDAIRLTPDVTKLEVVYPTNCFPLEPAMVWQELQEIAESYVAAKQRRLDLQREGSPREIRAADRALCVETARALAMARARFGATAFDRFLYTRVAPLMVTTSSMANDVRDEMRSREEGCR